MTKIKFSSFGKVKIKNSSNDKELDKLLENKYKKNSNEFDEAINNRILEIQREEFEKELEEVLVLKNTKGKSAAIFNNLKKICGNKKSGQEQVFMIDPVTNLPLFEPKEIMKASLNYCVGLLTNNVGDKDYEQYHYVRDMVHLVRCDDEAESELPYEAFEKRLETIRKKCKDKYKFIVCIDCFRKFGFKRANQINGKIQLLFSYTNQKASPQISIIKEISIQRKQHQNCLRV